MSSLPGCFVQLQLEVPQVDSVRILELAAQDLGIAFIECSAKDATNVEDSQL